VRRGFIFLAAIVLAHSFLPWPRTLNALTDEEKKRLFLKAREEMQTVTEPTPPPPGTKPKPKPKPKPTATATPAPVPEETPEPTPKPTPKPAATQTPSRKETPAPILPPQTPAPPPKAPVVIKKSGFEEETEMEPTPPPKPRALFDWGPHYRYLTRSVRQQIDRAPVKRRRWRYIVVHNSGTRQGNARVFDYYHRHVRRMQNGLAYHFVIGNGSSSGNGQIEVGARWNYQLQGGHVHSDYLNNIALGICLVGDYNRDKPTRAQLEALDELIHYLRQRVGNIDRRPAIVKPHKEINPPAWPTDCPGDRFPVRWLHEKFD
jgi:hypothetical protein